MKKLILLLPLLLVGCDCSSNNLNTGGKVIGTLSDGREIRRYEIWTEHGQRHYVYLCGDVTTTISPEGKHQGTRVTITTPTRTVVTEAESEIIIDGRKYK